MTTTEPAAQAAHRLLGPSRVHPPEAPGARWRSTAQALVREMERGNLDLPRPGQGRTWDRWEALRGIAHRDLSLARLVEGHANATAVLAELECPAPETAEIWGVWTERSSWQSLRAQRCGERWTLSGTKAFCSGARTCTHAMVTAELDTGEHALFAVRNQGTSAFPGQSTAAMAADDNLTLAFEEVPAALVCSVADYTGRPGFHHASTGVAACWYGGARALADGLAERAGAEDCDPYVRAHLGAVERDLCAARAVLRLAAGAVDQDPEDTKGLAAARALSVRSVVASACWSVIQNTDEVLRDDTGGGGVRRAGLRHARASADLAQYVRQHRGERDLARLGALVARRGKEGRDSRRDREDRGIMES